MYRYGTTVGANANENSTHLMSNVKGLDIVVVNLSISPIGISELKHA